MRTHIRLTLSLSFGIIVLLLPAAVSGQGLFKPLTYQALDQFVLRSARSMGLGGAAIALGNESSVLFSNPAALMQLETAELRFGGTVYNYRDQQEQDWLPNRFYPNFSLLMENMLDGIQDPVVTNPADKLQKPYDTIMPDWENARTAVRPALLSAAVPFEIEGIRIVAGVGFAEAVNLDYYYRNNNNLDPNIGQYRPSPMPVLRGTDTLAARWYSSAVQREGAIYRITPAASVTLFERFSLGAAVTVLTGSSDDSEIQIERGRLLFDAVYRVRNDSVYFRSSASGTSTYSGVVTTIGAFFRGEHISVGFSVQPSVTIERTWDMTTTRDTTGSSTVTTASGADDLRIPLQLSIGFALYPTERWSLGVDYTIRQFDDVTFTSGGGSPVNPWLSSKSLRGGIEFRATDWLRVRGGYREEVQTYAPEGAGLIGEPVRGDAYTAGLGMRFGILGVDMAYEYKRIEYQDIWMTNVNTNTLKQHTIVLETSIQF